MVVKAVNDTAGYNGLVPTVLVFGIYSRISQDEAPLLSILQRAKAIKRAITEVSNLYTLRQVNDTLYQRNRPQTLKIYNTSIGSQVLI